MLYPIQNNVRNRLDLSGIWNFKTDPEEVGEHNGWFNGLAERASRSPCREAGMSSTQTCIPIWAWPGTPARPTFPRRGKTSG